MLARTRRGLGACAVFFARQVRRSPAAAQDYPEPPHSHANAVRGRAARRTCWLAPLRRR